MPGKMARSAAHPPFRVVHVAKAVRATRLSCQNAGKAQKSALVRRFIWGIPDKEPSCRCSSAKLARPNPLRTS
jgi:hypothetical protein